MERIKLTDALANLRRELREANVAAEKEELKLTIDAVDVEFAVEIVKKGEVAANVGGKIDLDFFVIEGGLKGGGEMTSTHSHSIKLHLKPNLNGHTVDVEGKSPVVDD